MKHLEYSKKFFLSLYDNWRKTEAKLEKFKRKIARRKIKNIFSILKKRSTKCFTNFILRGNTDFKKMFEGIKRFEVRIVNYYIHLVNLVFHERNMRSNLET